MYLSTRKSLEPDTLMQLLSTDYKFAVSFSILVIVLLFRPTGIFQRKSTMKQYANVSYCLYNNDNTYYFSRRYFSHGTCCLIYS